MNHDFKDASVFLVGNSFWDGEGKICCYANFSIVFRQFLRGALRERERLPVEESQTSSPCIMCVQYRGGGGGGSVP